MATIRQLFHDINNKLNIMSIGCGASAEIAKDLVKEAEAQLTPAQKDELLEIYNNLKKVEESVWQADSLLSELHNLVYEAIDPDTGQAKA